MTESFEAELTVEGAMPIAALATQCGLRWRSSSTTRHSRE